jgi:hypothetical protein
MHEGVDGHTGGLLVRGIRPLQPIEVFCGTRKQLNHLSLLTHACPFARVSGDLASRAASDRSSDAF